MPGDGVMSPEHKRRTFDPVQNRQRVQFIISLPKKATATTENAETQYIGLPIPLWHISKIV